MKNMPSIQLLEERHNFPGPYIFKVIGGVEDGFVGRAVVAVREALGADSDPKFELRQTRSGRHVSITLEPEVESAEQVLEVYQSLSGLDGVVLVM